MRDYLSEIYHDRLPSLVVLSDLEEPETVEEEKIRNQLRAVDRIVEEALIPSIEALANKKAEEGFYAGARFGAQLMAKLMEQ
ncbi:hypothetical protein AALC17_18635 [Oscillospiraceae bacterium 38-13]